MNVRSFAAAAAAIFVAHAANATVYFDSANVASPTYGYDGKSDGVIAAADSFTAGTPDFSQVSMLLSADTPTDGGSVSVFLVPDDGTGSMGVAGNPQASTSGGVFSGFSGATLVGTISDASLAATGTGTTLASLSVSPAIAASVSAPNKAYWIGLELSAGSSAEWYFGPDSTGAGATNQSNWYAFSSAQGGGTGTVLNSFDASAGGVGGPYALIVSTPEPAALAILGAGLAGLGYMRRRGAKRS